MRRLRVGTRGSDLARIQTRWVCEQIIRRAGETQSAPLEIEEIVIATHGDQQPDHAVTADDWPMGGFTSSIEHALLSNRIDFAVHSLKDLPTKSTPGTLIAAVAAREAAHDVLITAQPVSVDALAPNLRIGTSSPRRAAQIRRLNDVQIVPVRGNVPTRIARVGDDLDGVVLAAAGLRRLGLAPQNLVDLPIDPSKDQPSLPLFLPAPGQGALAVQVREGDDEVAKVVAMIDDHHTRAAVTAERELLEHLGGGCAAPVGAYATASEGMIYLRAQVFHAGDSREATDHERGHDPIAVAHTLAARLSLHWRDAR